MASAKPLFSSTEQASSCCFKLNKIPVDSRKRLNNLSRVLRRKLNKNTEQVPQNISQQQNS